MMDEKRYHELALEVRVIIAEKSKKYHGTRDHEEIIRDQDILEAALYYLKSMRIQEAEEYVNKVLLHHLFT